MLEELKEQYFDELRGFFPLHRLLLFSLGLVSALLTQRQTHLSFAESLLRLNFNDINFDAGNLLENAQLWHAALGIVLIFIAWLLNRLISKTFFKFLLLKLKVAEKAKAEILRISILLSEAQESAVNQLPIFEKKSDIARKKIVQAANLAELLMGAFICFGTLALIGNLLDGMVSLICLIFALISIYFSVYMYFSKYLKFDLLQSAVSGHESDLTLPHQE